MRDVDSLKPALEWDTANGSSLKKVQKSVLEIVNNISRYNFSFFSLVGS